MTRRTRLELDDPFGRVNVDDSAAALPHTPQRTWSRVGSRGPTLSKVNTPLRIVPRRRHRRQRGRSSRPSPSKSVRLVCRPTIMAPTSTIVTTSPTNLQQTRRLGLDSKDVYARSATEGKEVAGGDTKMRRPRCEPKGESRKARRKAVIMYRNTCICIGGTLIAASRVCMYTFGTKPRFYFVPYYSYYFLLLISYGS